MPRPVTCFTTGLVVGGLLATLFADTSRVALLAGPSAPQSPGAARWRAGGGRRPTALHGAAGTPAHSDPSAWVGAAAVPPPPPPLSAAAEAVAAAAAGTAAAAGAGPRQHMRLPRRRGARPRRRAVEYASVGRVRPLPTAVDLDAPGEFRRVAQLRSWKREIILFTADANMAGWGYHWVAQLRKMGYEHWVMLADAEPTCTSINEQWEPMVRAFAEERLSCAWSSAPRAHPGWAQWRASRKVGGMDTYDKIYLFWCTRWWVALNLLREGSNVLSLDIDAVLLRDVYPLLRAPPLALQDVIITINADNSQSLNCGFVYFNLDAAAARAGEFRSAEAGWPRSRCGESGGGGGGGGLPSPGGRGDVAAAEWVARLMWERVLLFLDVNRRDYSAPPKREVLWEQDVWNDLVKSLELQRRVFPWAVGYGHDSDLWPALGYQRVVIERRGRGGGGHMEKWVAWAKRTEGASPPWDPPDDELNARAFYKHDLGSPLRTLDLCSPRNASAGAAAPVPAGTTSGIPLGLPSARPLRPGRLMVAPTWLASLGNDPEEGWAAAEPPGFAYLHLTNMWHCFPHMCWSKAGRLFWLRAHGFWDARLDALGLTPRGTPFEVHGAAQPLASAAPNPNPTTRVLALPPAAHDAVVRLTPYAADGTRASSADRGHALRSAMALIHNLVVVAALVGRRPAMPTWPCEFVRQMQPPAQYSASDRARFGVAHPIVLAEGRPGAPTCHLSPGTWRPGGPDQCYHNWAMADFDFRAFLSTPPLAGQPNGSLTLERPPLPAYNASGGVGGEGDLDVGALRKLCRAAGAQAGAAVLVLEGLLPARDYLIDLPGIQAAEFHTERHRIATGRPRWHSLLQPELLRQLADDCPGAATFRRFRLACCGYFLAE